MANHDRLKALHTALVDTMNGYQKATEDAEPDVKPILEKARSLHHEAHADVHRMLTLAGETPDDTGSFMTTVHEAVIGVRSAVVGLDRGALSAFASGEETNLIKYDEAIIDEPDQAETLQRHRDALANLVAEMKRLSI